MFEAFDDSEWPGAAPQKGVETVATESMSFRDVLQHVYRREGGRDARTPIELRRLNDHLLAVLTACHEVDTARRRLMGSLNSQQIFKDLTDLLAARGDGLGTGAQGQQFSWMQADLRNLVEMATSLWDVAGRHFTRVTRLLPAQLSAHEVAFVPLDTAEIDRLAREAPRHRAALEDASDWRREWRGDRFTQARTTYLRAVAGRELAQAQWAGVERARQQAEPGIHMSSRGALAFARVVIQQDWQRGLMLMREAHACVTRHALYAAVLQLPEQLGLD
jgi:hypothetical protein